MSNVKDFAVSVELYGNESEMKKGDCKEKFTVSIPKEKYSRMLCRITAIENEKERKDEMCRLQFRVENAALDQIRNKIGNEGILVAYIGEDAV